VWIWVREWEAVSVPVDVVAAAAVAVAASVAVDVAAAVAVDVAAAVAANAADAADAAPDAALAAAADVAVAGAVVLVIFLLLLLGEKDAVVVGAVVYCDHLAGLHAGSLVQDVLNAAATQAAAVRIVKRVRGDLLLRKVDGRVVLDGIGHGTALDAFAFVQLQDAEDLLVHHLLLDLAH